MRTKFGKTILFTDNQFSRPAPRSVGGSYLARFNRGNWDSIKKAAAYVRATYSEVKSIRSSFDKGDL